jgi:hypothetical protein
MRGFTGLRHLPVALEFGEAPDRSFIPSLAKPKRHEPPAPPKSTAMKALASLPTKLSLSYAAESRVIFWNLVFAMLLSSLLLLAYLKKILFDF